MSSSSLAIPSTSYPPQAAEVSGSAANVVPQDLPAATINAAPYSFWVTERRLNVKSNDKRINEDTYALQHFLLTHASGRPTVLIECKGTHRELQTDSEGNTGWFIITDFHFTVDVSSALLPATEFGAPVWVVADGEPVRRGGYRPQVDYNPSPPQIPTNLEAGSSPLLRREASPLEIKQALEHAQRREALALPPWACLSPAQTPDATGVRLVFPGDRLRFENTSICATQDFSDSDLRPPTKTLADWTEEYCASWRPLKEFQFMRTVYGWDFNEVQRQVASSLASCHQGYDAQETATVIVKGTKVIVGPNNLLWRLLQIGVLRGILYITFIHPLIIWPIKRYLLGRCWKVAGSSFAFRRYEYLEDSKPGETVDQYIARVPQAPPAKDLKTTSRGVSKIVGQDFADWYSTHAEAFQSAASSKTQTDVRNPIVV